MEPEANERMAAKEGRRVGWWWMWWMVDGRHKKRRTGGITSTGVKHWHEAGDMGCINTNTTSTS